MEKEISALNDIRKFINVLNDNLTDKMQENTNLNQEISKCKTEINTLKSNISQLNEQGFVIVARQFKLVIELLKNAEISKPN